MTTRRITIADALRAAAACILFPFALVAFSLYWAAQEMFWRD